MAFFLLFYACYFYPRRYAMLYVIGCVGIALSPAGVRPRRDRRGLLGELIVICAAYVTLGWLIMSGKTIMVELREQARLALAARSADRPAQPARAARVARADHMTEDARVGMILADLDGFKDVNTLHGYPAGDAVLCETARTLQSCVRGSDFVARLGGDEFAVLTVHARDRGDGVALRRGCWRRCARCRAAETRTWS